LLLCFGRQRLLELLVLLGLPGCAAASEADNCTWRLLTLAAAADAAGWLLALLLHWCCLTGCSWCCSSCCGCSALAVLLLRGLAPAPLTAPEMDVTMFRNEDRHAPGGEAALAPAPPAASKRVAGLPASDTCIKLLLLRRLLRRLNVENTKWSATSLQVLLLLWRPPALPSAAAGACCFKAESWSLSAADSTPARL
jgi:hypothetical protein